MFWRQCRRLWRAAWIAARTGDDTQLQIAIWLAAGEREATRK